jgi:uncharacterized protein
MEKEVFIPNNKGQKLAASIGEVTGSAKLAVLLPGFLDTKDYDGIAGLARDLQQAGYTTIRFDATGTWASEGTPGEYSLTQRLADVDSVIAFAKEQYGVKKVLLAGHSMGGRVGFLYAARHPEVIGVVAIMSSASAGTALNWPKDKSYVSKRDVPSKPGEFITLEAPYSFAVDSLKYDVLSELATVKVPVLFVAGGADTLVSPEKVKAGYEAAGGPKKFVVVPGIGHDYRKDPSEVALVNREVLQFLQEYNL